MKITRSVFLFRVPGSDHEIIPQYQKTAQNLFFWMAQRKCWLVSNHKSGPRDGEADIASISINTSSKHFPLG